MKYLVAEGAAIIKTGSAGSVAACLLQAGVGQQVYTLPDIGLIDDSKLEVIDDTLTRKAGIDAPVQGEGTALTPLD